MAEPSVETQLYALTQRLEVAESALTANKKATEDAIKAINDERTQALKYGVITLGSIVLMLIGWITSVFASHLPGITK